MRLPLVWRPAPAAAAMPGVLAIMTGADFAAVGGNPAGFVRDGDWLAQIKDGNLTLKDAQSAQDLLNLDGHNGPPDFFATADHLPVLYSGGSDGSIVRWQLPTATRAVFDAHGSAVAAAKGDPQVPIAWISAAQQFAFVEAAFWVDLGFVVCKRLELVVGQELQLGDANAVLARNHTVE